MQCRHGKIFKICSTICQDYTSKGQSSLMKIHIQTDLDCIRHLIAIEVENKNKIETITQMAG